MTSSASAWEGSFQGLLCFLAISSLNSRLCVSAGDHPQAVQSVSRPGELDERQREVLWALQAPEWSGAPHAVSADPAVHLSGRHPMQTEPAEQWRCILWLGKGEEDSAMSVITLPEDPRRRRLACAPGTEGEGAAWTSWPCVLAVQ